MTVKSDKTFDVICQAADALGYDPDIESLAAVGIKAATQPNNMTRQDFEKAIAGNKDAKKEFKELQTQLGKYLYWSMPYLFLDDSESTDIKREPKEEQCMTDEMLTIAKELKLV